MDTPKVTIGLPFVDEHSSLVQAVRSVFAQTIPDWRLLLVQDGNDARSRELASAVADERVTLVADGRRLGLAARLNQIARLSDGDVLMRMDADDLMVPWRLERTIAELDTAASPVVASHAFVIDEENNVRGLYGQTAKPMRPMDYLLATPFIHPTIAGLRSWFLANPYDETIRRAEDKELWLRTREQDPVRIIPEPLVFYRVARVVSISKMLRTSRDDRAVMRRLRDGVVQSRRDSRDYVRRLLRSYTSDLVSVGANFLRTTEWIASRKHNVLNFADQQKAAAALRSTNVPVPGWD